jgi:DNA-binding NarL/FixJ family response regulator
MIADDHPLLRDGLEALISAHPGYEVVAKVGSGREAVAAAMQLEPDVVLMDIQMPDMGGIEATRTIVRQKPDTGILILTMFDDDDSIFATMRAGARGYVLKGAEKDEVMRAIDTVAAGGAVFGGPIASRIVGALSGGARRGTAPFPALSVRETEVLDLIARGLDNRRIADRLVLSQKTVANHVSSIFAKLEVVDRAQAIVKAKDAGMGEAPASQA